MKISLINSMTRSVNLHTAIQDDSDGNIEIVETKDLDIEELNINRDGFFIRLITNVNYLVREKDNDNIIVSLSAKFSMVYSISDYDFEYNDELAKKYLENNPDIMKEMKLLNSIAVNMELSKTLEGLKINSRLPIFELNLSAK